MFNDINIVQSAVSAFNNAALSAPAFFWSAVLSLPIFILMHKYAHQISEKIGWRSEKQSNTALCTWTVAMSFAWIILFGGNYAVLRDTQTVLPYVIATIIFISSLFIGQRTKSLTIRPWRTASKGYKTAIICCTLLVLFLLAISNTHTWWGPILQITSCTFGLIIGHRIQKTINNMSTCNIVMLITIVAILMQPEFFRFGQLGNLSPIHLIAIMLFGLFLSAQIATNKIQPQNRIHESAYVKLKWMGRVLVVLFFALFLITESVPMFLGTCIMAYIIFALSIKHAQSIPTNIDQMFFYLTICIFGILTTMPVITCLGILQMANLESHNKILNESKFLL